MTDYTGKYIQKPPNNEGLSEDVVFSGEQAIASLQLPTLQLTVATILNVIPY